MRKITWMMTSKTGRPDLDGVLHKLELVAGRGKTVYARPLDPATNVESQRLVALKDGDKLQVIEDTTA